MNELLSSQNIENLSPEEKRELLKALLEKQVIQWPLTTGQKALWYLYKLDSQSTAYNTGFALRITSVLNTDALHVALKNIYQRHPLLGAQFVLSDDVPVCKPAIVVPELQVTDLNGREEEDIYATVLAAYQQPFLLETSASRCMLFSIAPSDHIFMFSVHHIIFDDGSTIVLLRELMQAYRDAVGYEAAEWRLAGKPVDFGQYVLQEQLQLQGEKGAALYRFWKTQLDTMPQMPPLSGYPVAAPSSRIIKSEVGFAISATGYRHLKEQSRMQGVTVFSWLLAVFQRVVMRYTAQQHITVGIPVSGREHRAFADTIGYFVNLLPVSVNSTGATTFITYLNASVTAFSQAFQHKDLPFATIAAMPVAREKGGADGLVPVVFNYLSHNGGWSELMEQQQSPGSLIFSPYHLPSQEDAFDFTFELKDEGGSISGNCKFNAGKYEPAFIQSFCELFLDYLDVTLATPFVELKELDVHLSPHMRQQLALWNKTSGTYTGSMTVTEVWREMVSRYPERNALFAGDEYYTYADLDKAAAQLAQYLQLRGVKRGHRIGFMLSRNAEMIISMLGVLKAGAIYVPVDSGYPEERIRVMLETAGCSYLIADTDLTGDQIPANIACIGARQWADIRSLEGNVEAVKLSQGDGAYIMYTSGSTGRPKGVMTMHGNIVNLVKENRYVKVGPDDKFMLISNYVFDGCTFEIFGALLNGATLYLPTDAQIFDAGAIKQFIHLHNINIGFWTTAYFNQLIDADPAIISTFDYLTTGGEVMSRMHISKAFPYCKRPGSLINVYGPTECTTFSTYYPIISYDEYSPQIPIGQPLSNVQTYILNEHLHPVPIGARGELYIGGAGVSAGYLPDSIITEERFIPAPWDKDTRIYATGDLVAYRPDGMLHYAGRKDEQLKFRGYRVEPAEISHALCQHPQVLTACVLHHVDADGNNGLYAFVASGEQQPAEHALRDFLMELLPHYMVPAYYYCLPELPLNQNGKVDRSALIRLISAQIPAQQDPAQPFTPAEMAVAAIWEELLNKTPGLDDNFFAQGGHSLLASRLCTRLTAHTGADIQLAQFVKEPTIRAISKYIIQHQKPPDKEGRLMKADRGKFRHTPSK